MTNKKVGIKYFQANLSDSYPEVGEVTTITKRNLPAYELRPLEIHDEESSKASVSLSASSGPSLDPTRGPSTNEKAEKEFFKQEYAAMMIDGKNICPNCGQEIKEGVKKDEDS